MNYVYPALLMLLMLQCQNELSTQPSQRAEEYTVTDGVKFGQEFTLERLEQVIAYGGEAPRRLMVSALQLADSRCPANAMCVQYGSATVLLSASSSQGENNNIQLCIGDCGAGAIRSTHTAKASVGATDYNFTLKEVQPFPGLEKEGEVKKAVLVVEKESEAG